jgi:hypothetical protein
MVRRWHADPFGFLRLWNELPASQGTSARQLAPEVLIPLERETEPDRECGNRHQSERFADHQPGHDRQHQEFVAAGTSVMMAMLRDP